MNQLIDEFSDLINVTPIQNEYQILKKELEQKYYHEQCLNNFGETQMYIDYQEELINHYLLQQQEERFLAHTINDYMEEVSNEYFRKIYFSRPRIIKSACRTMPKESLLTRFFSLPDLILLENDKVIEKLPKSVSQILDRLKIKTKKLTKMKPAVINSSIKPKAKQDEPSLQNNELSGIGFSNQLIKKKHLPLKKPKNQTNIIQNPNKNDYICINSVKSTHVHVIPESALKSNMKDISKKKPIDFISKLKKKLGGLKNKEIDKIIEDLQMNQKDLESLFRLSALILQYSKNILLFEFCLNKIQSIDLNFKKKEISFALAKVHFMKGNYDKSLYYLKKNYNYSIKKDISLNYMIKILLKQKNDSKALIACEKWAELSPQNPRIFYLKGKINYRNHEFEEAMQMFIKVIEQNLNHYKALLYLGFIKQLWEESIDDAITCFESVISNKFSSSKFRSRAYFGMSLIYQNMNLHSSIDYMIMAIKYSPKDWQFKKNLANLYVKNKNFSKAVGVFKSLLKESNENLELLYSLATLYIIKEQFLKAMKYLMRVIELSGKQLEIRFEGVFANIFYSHKVHYSEMDQTSNMDFSMRVS